MVRKAQNDGNLLYRNDVLSLTEEINGLKADAKRDSEQIDKLISDLELLLEKTDD
jgi:hypothetical protein